MKILFIFLLSLFYPLAYAEVCLSLKKETTELNDLTNFDRAKISPSGNHLLYNRKQNIESAAQEMKTEHIFLFDLETKEKTEFTDFKIQNDFSAIYLEPYGFSKSGSLAWALSQGSHSIKVRNFITEETRLVSFLPEGSWLQYLEMSKDRSKLFSASLSNDTLEKIEKIDKENKSKEEKNKLFEKLQNQSFLNFQAFDMKNFEKSDSFSIPMKFNEECSVFRDDMSFAVVSKDGSLYIKKMNQTLDSFKVFDPIEGIEIISMFQAVFSENGALINCAFKDENTVVINDEKKNQLVLRRIKEREEYIIKKNETLTGGGSVRGFFKFLYYPFIIGRVEGGTLLYHIPSGQAQILSEYYIKVGKEGKLAITISKEKKYKLIYRPFDSSQRRVLLEFDMSEVKLISQNEDGNLFFIGTVFGDFFIANGETGHVKKHFLGEQFRRLKISDSGNAFLAEHLAGSQEWYYKTHKVQTKCIEPSFSKNLDSRLMELADETNPIEDSLLSVLTGAFQDEEKVKKHSELLQPFLWKIFLHYPLVYLDLHFRYPSLKFLPPFPISLIEDEGGKSQVRESLISLFDNQIQFRHTKLSHWSFVFMLEPLLSVLEDEEKDFYIEKISISLSNGAAKSIPLFQDVFQSKLFYIVYSHVKAWFGRVHEPVSDITVLRKKNSVQTLILSSEPIQNHSSTETAFGIHYAIVKDLSLELDISEIKPGEELVDSTVEWSLLNGSSYRAFMQIHVQDNYLESVKSRQKNSGPDYESVWQDQQMTGLVIVGSSLRSFSKTLLENYLSYFEDQGFQFSSLAVSDFQPFLKEKIASCELDYFLKESHSDGDERNVFRFDRFNSVLKGVRQTEGGQTEVVYLAFPKPFHFGERETALFSNSDLADLIRQREQKGCGEITYFNTSCWAHVKARYELETVNSPLLLNIPSKSLSDTFLNQEGDSIRELIHAYRSELDFNGFRKSLEKNEGYKSGKINQYIFPDEKRYYKSIFEHIKIPLKIQIDLEREEDGEWVSVSPDEALS